MDGKTLNFREKHAALTNISGNDGLFFFFSPSPGRKKYKINLIFPPRQS
jgi:hypothetical protein